MHHPSRSSDNRKSSANFTGPWGAPDYPLCEGDSQSPIDLRQDDVEFVGEALPDLEFSAGYFDHLIGHIVNNGHTRKLIS